MKTQQSKKGAILLIAILMASIMLSVGLGVYHRTYKEIYFASFWKQVQLAFLAADTGFECALYRDLHPPTVPVGAVYFATSTDSVVVNTFDCGGVPIIISSTLFSELFPYKYATSTIGVTPSSAFKIEVVKITNFTVGTTTTKIISYGYNTADFSNPRLVERGLKIEY